MTGDQLIAHGVKALKASAQDTDLTEHNVSIGVLGRGENFRTLTPDELRAVIAAEGNEEEKMQVDWLAWLGLKKWLKLRLYTVHV